MKEASKESTSTIEVFFSYSHTDNKMREKLEKHLSALRRENVITGWHDRKIMPGTEWKNQIDEHIETSHIIVLLISADFLNSDYCYDVELKRAIARQDAGEARLIPIILRPCDWLKTPFGKLQALPRDGKPVSDFPTQDHAFSEVARGIRRVVEEMGNPLRQVQSSIARRRGPSKRDKTPANDPHSASPANSVQIPKEVAEKLERMRFINAGLKSNEELMYNDALMAEYRTMLAEMVETFLPLVKQLVKAGLLTININIDDINDLQRYSTLTGEPTIVFDNGSIWIDTEYAGGNLRKRSRKDAGAQIRSRNRGDVRNTKLTKSSRKK
jgi:hypothetical protein